MSDELSLCILVKFGLFVRFSGVCFDAVCFDAGVDDCCLLFLLLCSGKG